MTPSLPMPTDNIYKFRALLGLTLMVVTIFSFCSVYNSSLEQRIGYARSAIPISVKGEKTAEEETYLKLYTNLIDISKTNEKAAEWSLLVIFAIGVLLCFDGMLEWKMRVQKRDDRIADLQELKLELETKKLQAEISQMAKE